MAECAVVAVLEGNDAAAVDRAGAVIGRGGLALREYGNELVGEIEGLQSCAGGRCGSNEGDAVECEDDVCEEKHLD